MNTEATATPTTAATAGSTAARHRPAAGRLRRVALPALAAIAALGGCAALSPGQPVQPGQTEAEAAARLGRPTARYPNPGGGDRLEFATGPFGKQTWMVDVDTGGRVLAATQVLTEPALTAFQERAPGMTRAELLRNLGTPGQRRTGMRQGGELWSWRYQTNDCLWFQVSIGDDALVRDGGFGIDPVCDAPSDKN